MHIFNSLGLHRTTIGTKGSEIGNLRDPRGGTFTPDGRVAVADTMNDRIQFFNSSGQPVSTLGEKGNKLSQFSFPADVQFIGNDLMVVDAGNSRVQIFYNSKSDKVSNFVDVYYYCANFHGGDCPCCRYLPLDSVEISLES